MSGVKTEQVNEVHAIKYEMDYYAITGMVTTNTYSFDNPFVVHTHYTDTRFTGNSVVTESDYEKDLVFLFFVDDWADAPSDTNHIGILPVLTNWSIANGYTDSFLHAERQEEPEELFVAADTDVFAVAGGKGVFCVETKIADGAPAPPLDVKICKRDGDQYGNLLGGRNAFNVYSTNGLIDNVRQRVYYTTTDKEENSVFVRIASTDPAFAGGYGIRVFRARPVIPVHGISVPPYNQGNVKAGDNALGNWEDCLPWDACNYPCVCYSFSWDSYKDALDSTGKGKINHIVSNVGAEPGNPNVPNVFAQHGNMKVVLIGHSMGGYIVR